MAKVGDKTSKGVVKSTRKGVATSYKPDGPSPSKGKAPSNSPPVSQKKQTLDIITDPVTKKQFSRDTSVAGSTYQPYTGESANRKAEALGYFDDGVPIRNYAQVNDAGYEEPKGAYRGGAGGTTVVTNANVIEKKIPQLQNKANALPVYGGSATFGDVDENASGSFGEDYNIDEILGLSGGGKKKKKKKEATSGTPTYDPEEDPALAAQMKLLKQMQQTSDRRTKSSIGSIQAKFDQRRADQQAASASGLASIKQALNLGGSSRYAPISSQGTISAAEQAGIRAIADLDASEKELVMQAKAAQEDNDFRLLEKKLGLIETVRQEKAEATQALADEIRESEAKKRESVDEITIELAKNGAPVEIINEVKTQGYAGGVPAAVAAAGSYLRTGDYAEYVRAVEAGGGTPVDVGTFYARDIYGDNAFDSPDPFTSGDIPFQATIAGAASYAGSVKGEESARTQMADLAKNGDYPALLNRMEGLARKGMGAAPGADVATAQNSIKALDNMSKVLRQYQEMGGNMGYLKGTAQQIATRFGQLATDPRFASIATQLTAAFQVYRQNMTGAAFGAKENAEYKSVFPSSDKGFQLNAAVMDGLKNYYKENVDNAYETQLGEGYTHLKDYVEKGLTPTGKILIRNEDEAKSKVRELGEQDPEVRAKFEGLIKDRPDLPYSTILEIGGYDIATSNEVSSASNPRAPRPVRNKNPLNIKASEVTLAYPGVVGTDPSPATDGGKFLVFESPADGYAAARRLLSSSGYKGLNVDAALRRWSNNGYGAEIVPEFKGKVIGQLTPVELDSIVKKMAIREGYA